MTIKPRLSIGTIWNIYSIEAKNFRFDMNVAILLVTKRYSFSFTQYTYLSTVGIKIDYV